MRLDAGAERMLLLRVARGDGKAFREMVDHYWWPVYYNVLTLTKNTATAEELTQDIFLKLWEKRAQLAEVRDFMSFVFILGRNQVFSAMRRKILGTEPHLPEDLAETDNLPQLSLEYKETWRAVLQAIDSMPAKQQQVFRMSRIEGMTNNEIVERTGLSLSAVKWHIVAGLNTLRIFLASRES
ncbi:MAG: sigma-70 family RNA polymerase sigma factor [Bacteroidetes bacterium]|nr:sigma-70 family RNA polymerase sigma factor [Bacteroidota bacterium]